ncbi:MAG: hypothetical protein QY323_05425 [Patescibacteria group bacterium]|nr:MAG: hypothetical protein QY323_05425 [Patescibacteria group bacterium]
MHAPIASTRFSLRKRRLLLSAAAISLVLTGLLVLVPRLLGTGARAPRAEKVYSPLLKSEVETLSVYPLQGPERVRVCLYGRDLSRCTDDRWIPIDRVDVIAAALGRVRQPGERDVLGCLRVERGVIVSCKRHNFSLTLAESR